MRWVACVATTLALLVAGCSSTAPSAGGGDEILIESSVPTDAAQEGGAPAGSKGGARGHLAGVVVDEAVRPVEGAVVRLPTLDLEDVVDRDGGFAFVDLAPGSYAIEASAPGHYDARSVVEVHPGEFTRLKFVLAAVPPVEPYHTTWEHRGFMQAWAAVAQYVVEEMLPQGSPLCRCRMAVQPEPNVTMFVYEAIYKPAVPLPPGNLGDFYWWLYEERNDFGHGMADSGYCYSPCHLFIDPEDSGARYSGGPVVARLDGPDYWVTAQQSFDLYLTAWHNGKPPVGWGVGSG